MNLTIARWEITRTFSTRIMPLARYRGRPMPTRCGREWSPPSKTIAPMGDLANAIQMLPRRLRAVLTELATFFPQSVRFVNQSLICPASRQGRSGSASVLRVTPA
jgi:hypothetical protein